MSRYLLACILFTGFSFIQCYSQFEKTSEKITYWKTIDNHPINFYHCCHPITTWERNGSETMLSLRTFNYINDSSYPNFQFDYRVYINADTLTLIIDKIIYLNYIQKTKLFPSVQSKLTLIKTDSLEISLEANKKNILPIIVNQSK